MQDPEPPALLPPPEGQQYVITRQSLADGSLLARIRADAPAYMRFRSEAELDAELATTMAELEPGADLWLFGYGSLIWNPVIHFTERRAARITGYHRSYCIWLELGRGSPEHPGLMLALDEGGDCGGVAYRIPASEAAAEMRLVWRREMAGGAYRPAWVTADTVEGPVHALTFVMNHDFPRYVGALGEVEIAERVATASGMLGSCSAYLFDTIAALEALGLRDPMLDRIDALVRARQEQAAASP
jgi:cation transport protein ChaC